MSKVIISLSSNFSKRQRRLELAEKSQNTQYSVAQFIQIMKEPKFDVFYQNQFKTFLIGRSQANTNSDKLIATDTELDLVGFLNSMLINTSSKENAKIGDRTGTAILGRHRNSRVGSRIGVSIIDGHRNT